MAEQIAVFALFVSLLYALVWVCHQIAYWSLRTPRSGYLILSIFALFVLVRSLP